MSLTIDGANNALLDTNSNEFLKVSATASAVNEFTATNAATGNPPKISATGGDTNISFQTQTKGTGTTQILDGNGNEVIIAGAAVASAVNEVTITNAATGNDPSIAASGGDTNIDLNLQGKGSGGVVIGSGGAAITKCLKGSTTWDPGSIADAAATSTTVTVTGAVAGNPCIVSHTQLGANAVMLTGHVSAADTVTVVLFNKTGGNFDCASGTLNAFVFQI